jgi:hypothetical protein
MKTVADQLSETIEGGQLRNGEVAAIAAGAEAHLTGELTVWAESCGPSNLHLFNGLFDCQRSRVPVLAVAAQIPSTELGTGYFQETQPEILFKECSHCSNVIGEIFYQTCFNRRDGFVLAVCRLGIRPSRNGHASARRHLFPRNRSQRGRRYKRFGAERINSGQSGAQRRHRHDCRSRHKQRRGALFDLGDFANGNVWIARDLRRWRNGNGNRNDDGRHRSHDGWRSAVRNINVVGNINLDGNRADVGRIDIVRNGGNIGANGNVRLRLEQHCFIFVSSINVGHLAERQRPSRSPVGFLRDWQSWG